MTRRGRTAVLLAPLALALVACSAAPSRGADASDSPAGAFGGPDCPDVLFAPSGDVAAGMAFGWDPGPHAWGDTVEVRVCLAGINGVVTFDQMPGVNLDPPTRTTRPGAPNLVTFRVTVGSGASGTLRLRVTSSAPEPALGAGPTITADGTGWRFERPKK